MAASALFSNLPVRRNYYKEATKKKEELKRVERLLMAAALVTPHVRVTLYHNSSQVQTTDYHQYSAVLGVGGPDWRGNVRSCGEGPGCPHGGCGGQCMP